MRRQGRRIVTKRMMWSLAAVLLSTPLLRADVKLPAIFGDGMVLQRDTAVNVWGEADAGEDVAVAFDGVTQRTKAGKDGHWSVKLPAHVAGGPWKLEVTGHNAITLSDVLVGEVWVLSGQSNMEWSMKSILLPDVAKVEFPTANYPAIRYFKVKKASSPKLLTDVEGAWKACSPETVPDFAATGYYFGRKLYQELNVPIGLVNSTWGGTRCEPWTTEQALAKDPAGQRYMQRFQRTVDDYPAAVARYTEQLKKWEQDAQAAKAQHKPAPRKPQAPTPPDNSPGRPAGLYNAMIVPLIPLTIKGVAWYQGESNAYPDSAWNYRTLFPLMIQDWRQRWGQGDFPFLFVQLANFQSVQTLPVESDPWAMLRESQAVTAATVPNTGMAVIIDTNDIPDTIHPKDKVDVGDRLGLVALAKVYGKPVVYAGPTYDRMAIEGSKVRLYFAHTDGGLVTHPTRSHANDGFAPKDPNKLLGFAIAGEDGKAVWADAVIDHDTVIVSSPEVPNPKIVYYDWARNPIGTLFNGAGLPAGPFRTDPNAIPPLPAVPAASFPDSSSNMRFLEYALVAGRFKADSVEGALAQDFVGEATIHPIDRTTSGGVRWQLTKVLGNDRFNFDTFDQVGPEGNYAEYFSFWLNSPRDMSSTQDRSNQVNLLVFAGQQAKLLVGGVEVKPTAVGSSDGRAKYDFNGLPLHQGWNPIILKVAVGRGEGTVAVRLHSTNAALLKEIGSAVQVVGQMAERSDASN